MRGPSLLALTGSLLVALACAAPASKAQQQEVPLGDFANHYLDGVIEKLGRHLKKNNMDSLLMKDQVIGFSKKMPFITVRGSIGLTDGRIHGLSTIHRLGNCEIRNEGTKLIGGAKIGVNNLWGAFNGHAQFMGIGLNVKVSVAVDSANVAAQITADLGAGGATPQLDRLDIEISEITIKLSGLGPLNWITNQVTNILVNKVRGNLIEAIVIPVRETVKKVLKTIVLPKGDVRKVLKSIKLPL